MKKNYTKIAKKISKDLQEQDKLPMYIKLCKEFDEVVILEAYKATMSSKKVQHRGKYFMYMLKTLTESRNI